MISKRYRLRRAYVARLLEKRGIKPSAQARADAMGISKATAWRLFCKPTPGKTEFFAGPDVVNAVNATFPDEPPARLWEAA